MWCRTVCTILWRCCSSWGRRALSGPRPWTPSCPRFVRNHPRRSPETTTVVTKSRSHDRIWANLEYAALKILPKRQLLLVERIQCSPGSGGFRFRYALLAVDQVDFDVRCWKSSSWRSLLMIGGRSGLPGRTLDPGLAWSPRARITSTSRNPFW